MTRPLQDVDIEINIPSGNVFRGFSKAVSIKAGKLVIIEFRKNQVNYVSLGEHAELTFQNRTTSRCFLLKNAMARLDRDKLSILAEAVMSTDEKSSRASKSHIE